MSYNNFRSYDAIYKKISPKDFHLTWNVMLYYLVNFKDKKIKMLAIYEAYTIDTCRILGFIIRIML